MSDILFWNEARRELDEKKLLNKCNTFVDSLMANDYIYPHPYNETKLDDTTMDNVAGNSLSDFNRQLKKFTKLLNNRLSETGVSAIDDNFTYHHKFKDMKGNNKGDVYLPFTLMLDDGQILLALAKLYEGKEAERKSGYQVVKWFLNEEDITKAVYGNKAREILSDKSYNELAKRLAIVIKYNHKKFIKKNGSTLQKVLKDLEKENEELKARRDELLSQVEQLGNSEELENENNIEEIPNEDLTEVSEDPLVDTEETGAKVDEELGEKSKITDENLAEFYPNMSKEEKQEWMDVLDNIFDKRIIKIRNEIWGDLTSEERNKLAFNDKKPAMIVEENIDGGFNVVGLTVYGVKDNLEPIDEYIAKIKASPEYQEYIKENTPKEEEPVSDPIQLIQEVLGDEITRGKIELKNGTNALNSMGMLDNSEKYYIGNKGDYISKEFAENKEALNYFKEVYLLDQKVKNMPTETIQQRLDKYKATKELEKKLDKLFDNYKSFINLETETPMEQDIEIKKAQISEMIKGSVKQLDNGILELYNKDNELIGTLGKDGSPWTSMRNDNILNKIKEFIKNQEPQNNEIETRLKALLESEDMNYINDELNKIVDNSTDEELEAVEELLNEVENYLADLD